VTQGEAGRCEGDGRVGGASQKLVSAEHYRQQITIGSAQPLRGTTAARWVRLCACLKNLGVCIPARARPAANMLSTRRRRSGLVGGPHRDLTAPSQPWPGRPCWRGSTATRASPCGEGQRSTVSGGLLRAVACSSSGGGAAAAQRRGRRALAQRHCACSTNTQRVFRTSLCTRSQPQQSCVWHSRSAARGRGRLAHASERARAAAEEGRWRGLTAAL